MSAKPFTAICVRIGTRMISGCTTLKVLGTSPTVPHLNELRKLRFCNPHLNVSVNAVATQTVQSGLQQKNYRFENT